MKLTSANIKRVVDQIDASAVPEDHPLMGQLNATFGDHTFFLDREGLNIVEPGDGGDAEAGRIVRLAAWGDERRATLAPHDRRLTDVVVVLSEAA
jgi:hypothetical protein